MGQEPDRSGAAPLRVLHLLPDLAMGGGQQVLLRHLRAMPRAAVEHHVAFFGPQNDLQADFERTGVGVHRVPYRRLWSWPRTFLRLRSLVRSCRIDLIHTNGTFVDKLNGQLLSLLGRTPLVTTLHGMRPRTGRLYLRPRALLQRLLILSGRRLEAFLDRRTVRTFVAVSDAVLEDWRPYLRRCRVPGERTAVVYSGVPVEDFAHPDTRQCEALRDELGLRGRSAVLVAVSRLITGKNVHLLVPMVKMLRASIADVLLLVVGSGDEEAALRRDIAQEHVEDNVKILGQRTDVPAILAVSNLLVFTSAQEGFGLVALEALAAGRPVVSSPLPSLARLASTQAIRFVDRIEAGAFAEVVLEMLRDPLHSAELGRQAQLAVRRDWNVTGSALRYLQIYRDATRGENGPPRAAGS